jgi:hypothetical protein
MTYRCDRVFEALCERLLDHNIAMLPVDDSRSCREYPESNLALDGIF